MRSLVLLAAAAAALAGCSDAAAPLPPGSLTPDARALAATSTAVTSVTVSPSSATIAVGATQQFTATVRDSSGDTLTGLTINWRTTDTTVAKIDATGLATGIAPGKVTVRARTSGVLGTAALTVVVAGTGIPYGPFHLRQSSYGPPWTGTVLDMQPTTILSELAAAKAGNQRIVLRLARHRSYFQNPDGSFSLTLWKQELDAFQGVDFSSYIADGTIIAHYLFDEPGDVSQWGGKPVPFSDVEAAAEYSKQLWPAMLTVIRAPPTWLAKWTQPWVSLDAGWVQYAARLGDAATWIARETTVAQRIKIGLMASTNVINGGDGSSGIPGRVSGKWMMSAAEIERYSQAILSSTAVCDYFLWEWDKTYFARADIQAAVANVAPWAASHPATPCQ